MSMAVVAIGLGKDYGFLRALDSLDLSVPRGALFGLLGPNGAGKTTTFGLLCGFLQPTRGEARVLDVPSAALYRLGGRVAALPQDAVFPPQVPVGTQLVHFGRLMGMSSVSARAAAQKALGAVGLPEVWDRRGRELSHGMHKRVGLAQAIMGEPEVVFLDEPTAGLDPASARATKDLIRSLIPRATVVVSSHNLAEVQEICTHGAILDHGRVVRSGTIAELTKKGTEITIEVGATPPLAALEAHFGPSIVRLASPMALRLTCPETEDPAAFTARALRILLEQNVPILGLYRGTSLETAFLEATQRSA